MYKHNLLIKKYKNEYIRNVISTQTEIQLHAKRLDSRLAGMTKKVAELHT